MDREELAEVLEHAPDGCPRCGSPRLRLRRYTAGVHQASEGPTYREHGEVVCLACGRRTRWRHETPGPGRPAGGTAAAPRRRLPPASIHGH